MENLFNCFINDEALFSAERHGNGIETPLRDALLSCTPFDRMPHLFSKRQSGSGGVEKKTPKSDLIYIKPGLLPDPEDQSTHAWQLENIGYIQDITADEIGRKVKLPATSGMVNSGFLRRR